jgi:hypothetical protein
LILLFFLLPSTNTKHYFPLQEACETNVQDYMKIILEAKKRDLPMIRVRLLKKRRREVMEGSKVWWPMEGSKAWWPMEGSKAWWPMEGSKAWWPMERSKVWWPMEGSKAWWPMEGSKAWWPIGM